MKTRGEAELKALPLKAGGLKLLPWVTRGGPKLLLDGELARPLKVPGFRPPGFCSLPIELDGVV